MSEWDRSDPLDLSEFSDEELLLARAFLLKRRADLSGWTEREEEPQKVTQSDGWEWMWTESGGQARRTTYTTKEWPLYTSIEGGPAADAEWFDCSPEQYEALRATRSDGDEGTDAPEDEQP